MKEKRQTRAKSAQSQHAVARLVRRFVQDGDLSLELFEICHALAARILSSVDQQPNELHDRAEELALDFLLDLRSSGNYAVATKQSIKLLMSRFLTARDAPANHELWEIVSEVLRGLTKCRLVRRLDADLSEANTNWSRYSMFGPERDSRPFDEAAFEEAVAKIPWTCPRRQANTQTTRTPRVLAPSMAKELILQLLEAAGAPILFKAIFEEVRKRVPLYKEVPLTPDTDDQEAEGPPVPTADPDEYFWLYEESRRVTQRVWAGVEANGLHEVLCGYYLPKHVGGEKRTLQEIGKPQRVHEQVSKLKALLARELRIERCGPESDEFMYRALRRLTALVLDQLSEKCSENPLDKPFKSN